MTFNLTIRTWLHRALENYGKCWKKKTNIKMVNLKNERNSFCLLDLERTSQRKTRVGSRCRRWDERVGQRSTYL